MNPMSKGHLVNRKEPDEEKPSVKISKEKNSGGTKYNFKRVYLVSLESLEDMTPLKTGIDSSEDKERALGRGKFAQRAGK